MLYGVDYFTANDSSRLYYRATARHVGTKQAYYGRLRSCIAMRRCKSEILVASHCHTRQVDALRDILYEVPCFALGLSETLDHLTQLPKFPRLDYIPLLCNGGRFRLSKTKGI